MAQVPEINWEARSMARLAQMAYATAAYLLFLGVFLYAIAFVGDIFVPKTIDSGPSGPTLSALAIDALLLGVFAVQHSVMARPAFKRWWTRVVSPAIERSTYVLASSLALALLFWQWRPIGGVVWALNGLAGETVLGAFVLGWLIVLASTFMLSHFELFGLSQAYAALRARAAGPMQFRTPMLYGLVRHPIMLGFIIAFWAAPVMSVGRLVFAIATTLYILIALQFEEADLMASAAACRVAAALQRAPSVKPQNSSVVRQPRRLEQRRGLPPVHLGAQFRRNAAPRPMAARSMNTNSRGMVTGPCLSSACLTWNASRRP
jgi:protein-S-isoprenylcysteine O-methyltransferase Ste14